MILYHVHRCTTKCTDQNITRRGIFVHTVQPNSMSQTDIGQGRYPRILTRVATTSFIFVQSIRRMEPPEDFRKDKTIWKSKVTEKVYNKQR